MSASVSFAAEDEYVSFPDQYKKINSITNETLIGIDMTKYQVQKEEWNKVIKDYRGNALQEAKLFPFLKSQGINMVSVMMTTEEYGNFGFLNGMKTIRSAKEAIR